MYARRPLRRGFTLVEMLAVTFIIAILMSLLTVAIFSAWETAKGMRLSTDVKLITGSLESFRTIHGSYPPADLRNPDDASSDVYRFVHKTWPRYDMSNLEADLTARINAYDPAVFDPARSLVFWLSGFSPDPTDPFKVVGPRTPIHTFDPDRLVDGMFLSYGPELFTDESDAGYTARKWDFTDTNSDGTRQLGETDFEPYPMDKAYLYFDLGSYGEAYAAAGGAFNSYPGGAPDTFQIICSGMDDKYGSGGLTYPTGNFVGIDDSDNFTNFSGGNTLEEATDQ